MTDRQDDDGRTVVNMNVEGMPWYRPSRPAGSGEMLRGRQLLRALIGAWTAGLVVVALFSAGVIAFVLFCLKVWFR